MTNQSMWVDILVREFDRAITFYSAVLPKPRNNQLSQTGQPVCLNASGRLNQAEADVTQHCSKILQPRHPIGPHGFRAIVVDSEGRRIALHSLSA